MQKVWRVNGLENYWMPDRLPNSIAEFSFTKSHNPSIKMNVKLNSSFPYFSDVLEIWKLGISSVEAELTPDEVEP